MFVCLFDVDGTLILTGGAGGTALLNAFSREFGVEHPATVPFSGRTDRGIASNLFRSHGVDDSTPNWLRLRDEYLRRLPVLLPQRDGQVLPGIQRLLDQLAGRNDVAVGLLTGNAHDGARLKLEHFGLLHHFKFGGYGDDHRDRDDVAREALAAARDYLRTDIPPNRVWVIGDTPLDVQCARAIGARAAAVATGWHNRQQLAAACPDVVLDDFDQAELFLAQLA